MKFLVVLVALAGCSYGSTDVKVQAHDPQTGLPYSYSITTLDTLANLDGSAVDQYGSVSPYSGLYNTYQTAGLPYQTAGLPYQAAGLPYQAAGLPYQAAGLNYYPYSGYGAVYPNQFSYGLLGRAYNPYLGAKGQTKPVVEA